MTPDLNTLSYFGYLIGCVCIVAAVRIARASMR